MARVTLNNLAKTYDNGYQATKGVSFQIEDGEFVVFVGPSGCGKSTLLRLIAGLEDITSGDLLFDDERVNDLSPAARRIGMVFQSYALYPHMTVAENIAFGLKLANVDKAERRRRAEEAARILQLEPFLDNKPKALSGGQRQRVAIGRAIVRDPKVFLFDEPLSNLDAALRVEMRMQIAKLHRDIKATMIYVTHDQVEAMTLADRIVVLDAGEVRQIGAPLDLYHAPANRFVAGFIGSPKMNFVDAVVVETAGSTGLTVKLASGAARTLVLPGVRDVAPAPGERVSLGARPEHCRLAAADDPAVVPAEITAVEQLGNESFVYLESPAAEEPLKIRLSDTAGLAPGQLAAVALDPAKCHLFNADGDAVRTPALN